jgi:hypothetical protein
VSDELHATAALAPGIDPLYPMDRRLVGPYSRSAIRRGQTILDPNGTRTSTSRSSCWNIYYEFRRRDISSVMLLMTSANTELILKQ